MGYDADRLLYVGPNARGVKRDSLQNIALRHALLAKAQALPGVEHATLGAHRSVPVDVGTLPCT